MHTKRRPVSIVVYINEQGTETPVKLLTSSSKTVLMLFSKHYSSLLLTGKATNFDN